MRHRSISLAAVHCSHFQPFHILQTRCMSESKFSVIKIPVALQERQKRERLKQKRNERALQSEQSRGGNENVPVISCRRKELNYYLGQSYSKFVEVPLASRGWHHKKAIGDYFTINGHGPERSAYLRKWYNLMEENKEELARILTSEAGKPLAEARGEMMYGNSFLEWFSEEAKRIYGEVAQSPTTDKEMVFIRQPIGVVSAITPWNFPIAMITRKVGAAVAAGCTCVIKPAEDTPLTAIAAVELAEEAGFPPGVVNVVPSSRANTPAVGNLMCTSPKVAGVSFTGSTAVGKLLYKQCSQGIKRIGLELGGNAPFIVFDQANIKAAVNGILVAKFRNAGQTCISANRILVQAGIHDEFLAMLKEAVEQKLVVGDGMAEGVNIGPLINASQLKKVQKLVNDSIAQGAQVVVGGSVHPAGELFFQPTILTGVTADMACSQEEIFGPVIAIQKFHTEEEALEIANSTQSGLASYFYSQDVSQVWRVARNLEAGMVGINEGLISAAEAAFGGIKESGIGREGSRHGIDDYTYIKYLCFGGIN